MEKTQTKMVNSKKDLKEFVDFLMDCWNNQLYLAPETEEKLEHGIKSLLMPASEEGDEDAIHCMAILYDSGKSFPISRNQRFALKLAVTMSINPLSQDQRQFAIEGNRFMANQGLELDISFPDEDFDEYSKEE